MRAFIRNTIAAERARREENGQGGFSLIELIIVVVILGILAAVAIPIFLNMQDDARQNTVDTVAANAASQAAVQIAKEGKVEPGDLANLTADGDFVITLDSAGSAAISIDDIDDLCVTVTGAGDYKGKNGQAGPGCTQEAEAP